MTYKGAAISEDMHPKEDYCFQRRTPAPKGEQLLPEECHLSYRSANFHRGKLRLLKDLSKGLEQNDFFKRRATAPRGDPLFPHGRIQRGGRQGVPTPPPPLKNHKKLGFLSNTGPDPLKITKVTKVSKGAKNSSQNSMLDHYRHASETPFK